MSELVRIQADKIVKIIFIVISCLRFTVKITRQLLLQLVIAAASAVLIGCSGGDNSNSQAPVNVKLIAFNDFHGYLAQNDPNNAIDVYDPDNPDKPKTVSVGGGAFMATLINQLRSQNDNNIVVAAGDLIGASPAISSLTADEATIDFMNLIGLEVSAVGNHEFDRQKEELLRLQNGGCSTNPKYTAQSCLRDGTFKGASFKYLAANVTDPATNKTLFEPTYTKKFGSVTVGFIGLTLKDTPAATRGAGNLQFADEVNTINTQAGTLKSQGADAIIVLLHQGGGPTTDYINQQQSCSDISGAIESIVTKLNQVDVVISGHTHREYVCNNVAGTNILLTQASLYGNVVSNIDLTITPGKGVTAKTAQNIPVINNLNNSLPRGYTALSQDPAAATLINDYANKTQSKRTETKGYTARVLSRVDDNNGSRINIAEHPIGYVVADAFLEAAINPPLDSSRVSVGTINDTVAFINPGGIRNSINKIGAVTYDDLFSVAPFSNNLVVAELTGAQLVRLLEQQWEGNNCGSKTFKGICGRIMQPSRNFTYDWNIDIERGKATGSGAVVIPGTVKVNGIAVNPTALYKVVTIDFLAVDGGDNFTVFKQASQHTNLNTFDLDSIFEYFYPTTPSSPLSHPNRGRINCVDTSSSAIRCNAIPVSCNWPNLPSGTTCQ